MAFIVAPVVCPYDASKGVVSSLNSEMASEEGANPTRRFAPRDGCTIERVFVLSNAPCREEVRSAAFVENAAFVG